MAGGFNNPLVSAGGDLVYPQIESPNFNEATETGWAILKDGSAFFFNITAAGTIDASGGITVGESGGSEIELSPNVNQAFDVTTAIAGFLQAVGQFITTDTNEVVAGAIGALLLGTGTATKMTTALTSAFGNTGAAILIESENDAGTDTPVITFGTVTTPDSGTTLVYSPIATLTPYAFLLYGGSSGQTTVTKTSGSGTIPIPAGVSSVKAECWGASSGSTGSAKDTFAGTFWQAGQGGSGGEYAAEPTLAVTGGGTVAYSVGAGGTAGTGSITGASTSGAGGNSTLTGTSVTVTAHGAVGNVNGGSTGGTIPAGGTGSTNSVHFDGGAGGQISTQDNNTGGGPQGGCGGGSSAGPGGAGNPGLSSQSSLGADGGAAVTGGGAGGGGGSGSTNGLAGTAPGGGPGGGGLGVSGNNFVAHNGVAGENGQVKVTYSGTAPTILFSIASASGTDQFGTNYPAGIKLGTKLLTELAGDLTLDNITQPSTPSNGPDLYGITGHLKYVGTDGTAYNTGRFTAVSAGQTISSTNATQITGFTAPVVNGVTYRFKCWIAFLGGTSAGTAVFAFSSPPSTSQCRLSGIFTTLPGAGSASGVTGINGPALSNSYTSPTLSSGTVCIGVWEGSFTASANGTLAMTVKEGTNGDTVIIEAGSYFELLPVA